MPFSTHRKPILQLVNEKDLTSRVCARASCARGKLHYGIVLGGQFRTSICSHHGRKRISHPACNRRNSHSSHSRMATRCCVHSVHQIAVHTFAAGPLPGDESTNTFLNPLVKTFLFLAKFASSLLQELLWNIPQCPQSNSLRNQQCIPQDQRIYSLDLRSENTLNQDC